MTNKNVVQERAAESDLIGNEAITLTITQVREAWGRGAEDRLKLGELFSQLRKQVQAYRKNSQGLTYNQAVAKTGVPRGTAERYRLMHETFTSYGIRADVFLALAEYGCNLAADRATTPAGIVSNLPVLGSLDITDENAVEKLAKQINKDYPVKTEEKEPVTPIDELDSLLANLEKMPKNAATAKMIAETQSAITETQKVSLLTLAIALAPFIGKDKQWAEEYVDEVAHNSTLLKQRYREAVKFAKSATFLETEEPKTKGDNKQA